MKIEQFQYTWKNGWNSPLENSMKEAADWVIIFGEKNLIKSKSHMDYIIENFPNAIILSGSTAGEIHEDQVHDNTLSLTAIKFKSSYIKAIQDDLENYNNSFEAGKSLAKKYGSDGVLVNSILPGLIHTAMWERAATEIAEATGGNMEDVIRNNGSSVPVGRYGTSEEVASLITFLCTNAASYISGTSIEVDGGQSGHI